MLTKDQREARRYGLGGSDAAVVLGLSRWKTPYELWSEKSGQLEGSNQLNERTAAKPEVRWGKRLEGVILDAFAEESGIAVPERDLQAIHPERSYIIGSLDGLGADGCPVEAKTARYEGDWGDSGTDDIPDYYFPQVQQYLGLYPKAPGAHVAALIAGSDLRIYFVPRDDEFITDLFDAEGHFWAHHVLGGVAPEPTSLPGMQHRYWKDDGSSIECDSQMALSVADLKELRDAKAQLEQREEQIKLAIMGYMHESQYLIYEGRPIITWKTYNGARRFDSKRFEKDQPKLYEQYVKVGEAQRRFTVK